MCVWVSDSFTFFGMSDGLIHSMRQAFESNQHTINCHMHETDILVRWKMYQRISYICRKHKILRDFKELLSSMDRITLERFKPVKSERRVMWLASTFLVPCTNNPSL